MDTKNTLFIIVTCIITFFIVGFLGIDYIGREVEAAEQIEEYINVWTTKEVDIKKEPNANSDIVGKYSWNIEIPVTYINDEWAKIKGVEHYILRKFTSETPIDYIDCDVPSNNSIKSYMDYRFITLKSSDQYKLQKSLAYTGDNGLRMVNGRYCIAVGSYYTTKIGQYLDIELENGEVIKAILADCKADIHTDATNRMNPNGSVIEFVVETEKLDSFARKMGDISWVNNWNSKVVNIKVYDRVADFK